MILGILVVTAAVCLTELSVVRCERVAVEDPVRNIYSNEISYLGILGNVHRSHSSCCYPLLEDALSLILADLERNDSGRFEDSCDLF